MTVTALVSGVRRQSKLSLFKAAFLLTIFAISLNVEEAFGVEKASPVVKSLLIISAGLLAMTSKIHLERCVLAFVSYSGAILSALFTTYPGFSWDYFFRGSVSYLAPLLYLVVTPNRSNRDFILTVLAWMPVMELASGIAYSVLGIHALWYNDALGEHRLEGSSVPAFIAAAATTGAVAAVLMADYLNRPRFLLLAILDVVIMLLAAGRMATAVFALTAGAAFIWGFRRHARAKVVFAIGTLLVGGGMAAFLAGALIQRFSNNSLMGRDVLWGYLESFVARYPYFGVGLGHQYTLMPASVRTATGTFAAHNEYLRLLVEVGWVGLSILLPGLVALLLAIWFSPQVRRNPVCLVAFVAFFIFAATDNVLSLPDAFLLLVVATYGTTRYQTARAPVMVKPRAPLFAAGPLRPGRRSLQ